MRIHKIGEAEKAHKQITIAGEKKKLPETKRQMQKRP